MAGLTLEGYLSGLIISKLQKRIVSAAILAPVSFFIILYGGWPFLLFLAAWGCIAIYEWIDLSLRTRQKILFSISGVLYIAASFWCCYLLRMNYSVSVALLFICMVWASDIGAYAFGKTIGGPKMASDISPNKTWAGLAGAVICPFLLCLLFFIFISHASTSLGADIMVALIAGVIMGLVGQAGDLIISVLKRRAGAKDSGQLIPGHGGVLDRIDAMMLTAPVFLWIVSKFSHVFGS